MKLAHISSAICLLLISAQSVLAQIPSDCTVPSYLQTEYFDDVRYLTVQRILDTQSPSLDSIFVPQADRDSVWEGLAAIYNLTSPERDTVFDLFCIHQELGAGGQVLFHWVHMYVDTSYGWTDNWQNLTSLTGVQELDSILNLTGLTVMNYSTYFNRAGLYTSMDINVPGVITALEAIDGIQGGSGTTIQGDGNRIMYSVNSGIRHYGFRIGCGDCPSGCTQWRQWNFSVTSDCIVTYDGFQDQSGGLCVASPYLQCALTTGVEAHKITSGFLIFPNPATNSVTLQISDSSMSLGMMVSVTDVLGRILTNLGSQDSNIEFNVIDWPSGIYFVSVTYRNGSGHAERFVVQH